MTENQTSNEQHNLQVTCRNFLADFDKVVDKALREGLPFATVANKCAETEFEMRTLDFGMKQHLQAQLMSKKIVPATKLPEPVFEDRKE